uniref:Uncharacterized protein n=1 Tax=Aegilops tauschii subsp. strangulata TaxID=200361 RepID=A0A453I6Y7_AEGTS
MISSRDQNCQICRAIAGYVTLWAQHLLTLASPLSSPSPPVIHCHRRHSHQQGFPNSKRQGAQNVHCQPNPRNSIRVSAEWPSRAPYLYLVHTSSVNPRNRSTGATRSFHTSPKQHKAM